MKSQAAAKYAAIGIITVGLIVGGTVAAPLRTTTVSDAAATASPSASPEGLPSEVQAELDSLPAGTVIVPCNGAHPVLPRGIRPLRELGFEQAHPGFRYLSDGYCADNPSASPIPMTVPVVDGTPGQTVAYP